MSALVNKQKVNIQAELKKREAMTTAIPPQAMTVQNPVIQQKIGKRPTKTPKQPPAKVVPKSQKPSKAVSVEKKTKEEKIVKLPEKRKSNSSESDGISITKQDDDKGLDKRKLCCTCKQPYDRRFYICCNQCQDWFHCRCAGVFEKEVYSTDDFICLNCQSITEISPANLQATESAAEELYCLCRTPYDDSQFYICCDRCQDWFHGRCIGILPKEANSIDAYICPNCESSTEINRANFKILESKDYKKIKSILKTLMSHKHAWPFMKPVDPVEYPDYYKYIKEPMDLKMVEEKINSHTYKRLGDFIGDMTKIFQNCRYYNSPVTSYSSFADELESVFVQKIKLLRESMK